MKMAVHLAMSSLARFLGEPTCRRPNVQICFLHRTMNITSYCVFIHSQPTRRRGNAENQLWDSRGLVWLVLLFINSCSYNFQAIEHLIQELGAPMNSPSSRRCTSAEHRTLFRCLTKQHSSWQVVLMTSVILWNIFRMFEFFNICCADICSGGTELQMTSQRWNKTAFHWFQFFAMTLLTLKQSKLRLY